MQVSIKEMPDSADSESWCPTCQKQVRCHYTSYIKLGQTHKIDFIHWACGTTWTYNINTGEIENVKT